MRFVRQFQQENLVVKIAIKTHVSNLIDFQNEVVHLFFLQNEKLRSESVNVNSLFDAKLISKYSPEQQVLDKNLAQNRGQNKPQMICGMF